GGGGEGFRLPLILRGAHLTPDQQTRVREILAAHRTTMRTLTEQLRQAQDAMTDKLFAPGPVQVADLQPSVQRVAQLRTQLLQESSQIALEVRALLTPEQLAQAAQVKDRLRTLSAGMRELVGEGRPSPAPAARAGARCRRLRDGRGQSRAAADRRGPRSVGCGPWHPCSHSRGVATHRTLRGRAWPSGSGILRARPRRS